MFSLIGFQHCFCKLFLSRSWVQEVHIQEYFSEGFPGHPIFSGAVTYMGFLG